MSERETGLAPHERAAALGELHRIEGTLAAMAGWLDERGHPRAAILIEDAWRDLLAAQLLLDRDPAVIRHIVPHGRALGGG